MATETDDAVTVLVTRVVRPDREADFADWADEVDGAAAEFPGHRASIRLQDGQGLNHLAYQFDCPENLRRWEGSQRHVDLLRRGDEFSDEQHSAVGGRDTWFEVPSETPDRWKTFVLTWLAVYPALLVIATAMTDAMMDRRAKERGTDRDEAIESLLDEERPGMVLKRRGRPQEVADLVAFLCSARASFATGGNYRVDSGSVATISRAVRSAGDDAPFPCAITTSAVMLKHHYVLC